MPPTFLMFLGLIVYLGLTMVTLVVFVPMLFVNSKRLLAKKVITTVLISFPCLIIMGIVWTTIFIVPALTFSWLANSGYVTKTLGVVLTVVGVLIFCGLLAISSLYLWYIASRIIYQRFESKPINDFLEKDKVFKCLTPYLSRLKIYRPKNLIDNK